MPFTQAQESALRRIVQEEMKETLEYFRMSRPGFAIESNAESAAHGTTEFALTTDSHQCLHFYEQGNCILGSNKSMEIVSGEDDDIKEDDVCIGIWAENGDIHIKAVNGKLILEGNDVVVNTNDSEGQISLTANKTLYEKAPDIKLEGTNTQMFGKQTADVTGGSTNIHSQATDVELTSGDQLELGNVLSFIDAAQKLTLFQA